MAIQTFEHGYTHDNNPFTVFLPNGKSASGFFTNVRIDRKTLPAGWKAYDFREGDEEWLGQLNRGYVLVNHAGTFCTQDYTALDEALDKNDGTLYYGGEPLDGSAGNTDVSDDLPSACFDYTFNC